MSEHAPSGYQVSRAPWGPSRWVVSYKGDVFVFLEKKNALGEERLRTFKTKTSTIQAAKDHASMIAALEARSRR